MARKWTTAIYTSLTRTQAGALQDKNSSVLRLQLIKCLLMPSQKVKIHHLFPFSCTHPVSCILDGKLPTYLALAVVLWVRLNVFWKEERRAVALKKDKVQLELLWGDPKSRRQGQSQQVVAFQYLKGPTGKLERDFVHWV